MESLSTGHWLADERGDVVHARLLPDVRLTVSGDFESQEKKIAAARFIAHCLNVAIDAASIDDTVPERIYLGKDGARLNGTKGDVEYVRADIAATLSRMTGQLAALINDMAATHEAQRDRIRLALQAEAHIAVGPNECDGLTVARCYERGLHAGSDATRAAIKAAVDEAMRTEE